MKKNRRLIALILLALAFVAFWRFGRPIWVPLYYHATGRRTVADVVRDIGPASRARLASLFQSASVHYLPNAVALLVFKDVKRLELWAEDHGQWQHVCDYPIHGASGGPGPKLREGDLQVPEGVYRIAGLNPNSAFHLSMELNYPNAWDVEHARADGRSELGSDIFIHGGASSIGCLAMGDPAIEELFVLIVDTGIENVEVYIAPTDLRVAQPPVISGAPEWLDDLYANLEKDLQTFPLTGNSEPRPSRRPQIP